jgi:hypothetical protein
LGFERRRQRRGWVRGEERDADKLEQVAKRKTAAEQGEITVRSWPRKDLAESGEKRNENEHLGDGGLF